MRKASIGSIALALLLGLVVPGVASGFQEEGTLRIGGIWALSGAGAYIGASSKGLSDLAVDEINGSGGVLIRGKRVKLRALRV